MLCENCKLEHTTIYGSGRFCSRKCARGFSTKAKRLEINKKVSLSQLGKVVSEETKQKLRESWKNPSIRASRSKPRVLNLKYCSRDVVLESKPELCESCGIGPEYNGAPLTLQIHHIDGNRRNNRLENLQILCPNCHSQTDNFAGKGRRYGGVRSAGGPTSLEN